MQTLEQQLRTFFADRESDMVCIYLFGSLARNDARPDSDVDLALLYRQMPSATLLAPELQLAGELERHLGRPVDLVVLNRAPVDLIHRVLRDGVLVLERDRSARIRFEVAARNRYFDMQPILRRYRHPEVEEDHDRP